MEFDFLISVHTVKGAPQYLCNLNKGDLIMDTDTEVVYSSNVLCKEFQNSKMLELLCIADCNILYKFSTNLKEIL
ncbi:hypothetical protein PBI_121Q_366 [Escherichia phage 121Q]|uniref:Uncharacterized protein n=1 Tax=Escherichia phage 121Q TaxID=1555202 RepID=A0A097EXX1_9CAUD|nr:hypothetical protein PBI_121Q_366 [Escherichia phage 121Q]AIT14256.1 hypothetical protein PBI_121Q_366 [Escherichia phage 121Q]